MTKVLTILLNIMKNTLVATFSAFILIFIFLYSKPIRAAWAGPSSCYNNVNPICNSILSSGLYSKPIGNRPIYTFPQVIPHALRPPVGPLIYGKQNYSYFPYMENSVFSPQNCSYCMIRNSQL